MTNRLEAEAFERGVKYVKANARPLDVARLEYFLSSDNTAEVLSALATYQNEDGGFGHGIEPDFRTPSSTAMATSVGLQVLRSTKVGADHEIVRKAMKYLLATLDRTTWVWPIIDSDVELAPHAPWWNYSENLPDSWNHFRFNPTAELLGYCLDYSSLVPENVSEQLGTTLVQNIEAVGVLSSFYDIRCCLMLYDTVALPEYLRDPLGQVLLESAAALDPGNPHLNYFDLVPKPGSLLHPLLAKQLDEYTDRLIVSQEADGSWSPWWEWAEASETEWSKAEIEWRGSITRRALESLREHERCEV